MNIKPFLSFLFLLFFSISFSQQKISIMGKVTSGETMISDAIVELKVNSISKFAVTDKKGFYKFLNLNSKDTLTIKLNYLGYKPYEYQIKKSETNVNFNIVLMVDEPLNLKEVVIKSNDKIENTSRKSIYKVDQKDFIKSAKATEVLSSIPNIFVKTPNELIVEGTLSARIFIDGIEIMNDELKTLEAKDIEKVEVISNPSSKYGPDFLGAVVNIITKQNTQQFIKGSIDVSRGLDYNVSGIRPSISFKRGNLIVKSYFGLSGGDSWTNYNLERVDVNGIYNLSSFNNSKRIQKSSQNRINLKLSDKSSLNFSNSLFSYKFTGDAKGIQYLNSLLLDSYIKDGVESNQNWDLATVYSYHINENKNLFIKGKYYVNDNISNSTFNYSNGTAQDFNIGSKSKDLSFDIEYEIDKLIVFKKKSSFMTDLKFINRNYTYSNTEFYVNQNVINATAGLETEWTTKFSSEIAATFENTRNFNSLLLDKQFSYLLPTINTIYHFKNKIDFKFGYSRKILKPNASDMNDALLFLNPSLAKQGNSDLDPQIRNYYYISLTKAIKADNLSLKFYNESISNAISEVYRTQSNLLIQTLDNAAKYNSTGMNFGYRTKLFNKIMFNMNSGFDYNTFEDNGNAAVLKKNSGFTFRGNLSLNANFFKDKISLSFSGRQNGPNYSLLSKRISKPYLDISLNAILIKDKLTAGIYGQGLLGNSASGFDDVSSYNNFYQKIVVRNNTTNLMFSLVYSFGKNFNDRIIENNINNGDVRN